MRHTSNRFQRPQPAKRKFYQLNYNIQEPQLRVITHDGQTFGVLSKEQALLKAKEMESDLVLIAPHAKPPVAKIIDFQKFLYQEEKKEKEAKKGVKKSVVKDINLSLFIAVGDFERTVQKGVEFLAEGNQVRVNLTLRGREIAKKEMAFGLMKRYISLLGDVNVPKEPRVEGRVVRAVVSKKK